MSTSQMDRHESSLPIPDEFCDYFELILEVRKQSVIVREADDKLNDALDEYHAIDQQVKLADSEYQAAKKELKRLEIQWAERERLLKGM